MDKKEWATLESKYIVCTKVPEPNLYKVVRKEDDGLVIYKLYPNRYYKHAYISPIALKLSYKPATEIEIALYA